MAAKKAKKAADRQVADRAARNQEQRTKKINRLSYQYGKNLGSAMASEVKSSSPSASTRRTTALTNSPEKFTQRTGSQLNLKEMLKGLRAGMKDVAPVKPQKKSRVR